MIAAIWGWLVGVDWLTLVSGAALTTLGFGVRALMRAPMKVIGRDARFVRWFYWLSPQKPFADRKWEVNWKVTSSRFPAENIDRIHIRRFFKSVTFRTTAVLSDGGEEDCVFIGRLQDRHLTGRWYNPADEERGYHGVFQIKLHAGLTRGEGAWAGFSNAGGVQAQEITIARV